MRFANQFPVYFQELKPTSADRGNDDALCTEIGKFIHCFVDALAKCHCLDGDPVRIVERGDCRGCDTRSHTDCLLQKVPANIVFNHFVDSCYEDSFESANEGNSLRKVRGFFITGDDNGLGFKDGVSDNLKTCLPDCLTAFHNIGNRIGNTETDGDFDSTVDANDFRIDIALGHIATDDIFVGASNTLSLEIIGS